MLLFACFIIVPAVYTCDCVKISLDLTVRVQDVIIVKKLGGKIVYYDAILLDGFLWIQIMCLSLRQCQFMGKWSCYFLL